MRCIGTNVDAAKKLIAESDIPMIMTDDLDDAAQKAVKMAEICAQAEEAHLGVQFTIEK